MSFFSRKSCLAMLSPSGASPRPGVDGTDDEGVDVMDDPDCFFAWPNSVLRQREAKLSEQTVSPRL
jgi:hypothetical protein